MGSARPGWPTWMAPRRRRRVGSSRSTCRPRAAARTTPTPLSKKSSFPPRASKGAPMLLDMREVGFGYQDEELLLDGFDLHVGRGEFVALLGPSGCGKSTLLNLAAGLMMPLRGEIDFDGEPLNGL